MGGKAPHAGAAAKSIGVISKVLISAAVGALTLLSLVGPASALTIKIEASGPVAVGQAKTFRIAEVQQAVGEVTFTWMLGDGTTIGPLPDRQTVHTYKDAGHVSVIVLARDDEGAASASFTQTVHHPLTAQPPHNSSSIIIDVDRKRAWNVNPDNDSVSVIDTESLARVREVSVGKEPHSLAQAPDGTVWVTNQMSDEVVILERDTGNVSARIPLAYASQPRAIAFGPGGKAYVSLFATGKLVEIDASTRKVAREMDVGPTPAGVSVDANGRIFVTRFLSPSERGEIWVVSPQTFKVTKTIELPFDQTPDSESSGRGVPNYVASMVISPDGRQAWVLAKKDDIARGKQRDGLPMTSDNFVRAIACVIDLATDTEVLAKREDIDNRASPVSVVFSPLGDYAYLLAMASNWVGIYDGYTALNLGGIKQVGNAPDGLALSPNGRLFVNAQLSREVIAYDLSQSIASIDHIAPPILGRVRTVDRETLSASVLLGKQVFFNAADTRMSNDGYMACVSCHFGGYSDSRVWDFSDRGEGLRNTKSLLGTRGTAQGRVHWSANFDEIQDFERDIRQDFEGSGFMADPEFELRKGQDGHYDGFAKSAIGVSRELDGLADYFKTFEAVPRSPYRNADGSFTEAALEGRKIFKRAGCEICHSGPDFTDSTKGVMWDVGTLLPSSGERLFGKLEKIDTPTLKGIWQSAPYYHDGRAATLLEVFTKYNVGDKMGVTSNLSPQELDQLVEYLRQLDDVPEKMVTVNGPVKGACSVEPLLSSTPGGGTALWTSLVACALAMGMARRRRSRAGQASSGRTD